ncbi:MAG TPA: sigma-54-dependent Fis family transcriptional regulator [Polyangiaceae bacterium]|nr:sigma-54-dependent Fis family transcriptional regulator [Polyangiaceae bacterium]
MDVARFQQGMNQRNDDTSLHQASMEQLERRVMELALERTGAMSGAIFVWDAKRRGLALEFHVVDGVVITLPGALVTPSRDGRPAGVAMHVFESNHSRLTGDAPTDPHYAPYFLDVRSIAAVPIVYGRRPIGVLTVSAREANAFGKDDLAELEALAGSTAKFLQRAQLYRTSRASGRPFLIKGLSPEWLEVERRVEHVAATNAAVLVVGESGTGKELVANAIHFASRRASAPFVTVNCAAIPEQMLESVLFGHVRGAFTGATFDKIGEMKKADGGTLFLDELGELPMTLQPKVLRALESGEIQPLGSNRAAERVDVRLVCATNRDLPRMVREGKFRDDLYYRLGVMTIELPPLRSYKQHIEVLAHVFRELAVEKHGKTVGRIAADALAGLASYDFPGNMRELRNAIEHAVILADGDVIEPRHLPRSIAASPAKKKPATPTLAHMREEWLAPLEARWLSDLLADSRGSVREAAKRAGVDAVTLYRLLRRRGVAFGRSAQGLRSG